MDKQKLISLTKAVILLGIYACLSIPLENVISGSDHFFSVACALLLCYAFYVFDYQGGKLCGEKSNSKN